MKIELKHVPEHCPECGCTKIASAGHKGFHCNGHAFEFVVFDCRCRIEFVPNFMKYKTTEPCLWSDKHREQREKRIKAKENLLAWIDASDVDDDYKTYMKDWMNHLT